MRINLDLWNLIISINLIATLYFWKYLRLCYLNLMRKFVLVFEWKNYFILIKFKSLSFTIEWINECTKFINLYKKNFFIIFWSKKLWF